MKVELIEEHTVNVDRLRTEVMKVRDLYSDKTQFCITNINGDDDMFTGAGTSDQSEKFTKIIPLFKDTYIEELTQKYQDFFRWRILCIKGRTTYSVHRDTGNPKKFSNHRIHIPVITNDEAFLMFYEHKPLGSGAQRVEYHHLDEGNIYKVDTSNYHTAVNYHPTEERIHIVAERFFENE